MSSEVIRATSRSLAGHLLEGLLADPVLHTFFDQSLGGTMRVTLNNPEEMNQAQMEGVSLWLYQVIRDGQLLNAPPLRVSREEVKPTPLPLRLHYLVTPIVALDQTLPDLSPEREQSILGKVIQILYENPRLSGSSLADVLAGSNARLSIRLESLPLEDLARIWWALHRSYQLSVSYEVTLSYVSASTQPARITPVTIAAPDYGPAVAREES